MGEEVGTIATGAVVGALVGIDDIGALDPVVANGAEVGAEEGADDGIDEIGAEVGFVEDGPLGADDGTEVTGADDGTDFTGDEEGAEELRLGVGAVGAELGKGEGAVGASVGETEITGADVGAKR